MSKQQLQVSQERIKSKFSWKPADVQILEEVKDGKVNRSNKSSNRSNRGKK